MKFKKGIFHKTAKKINNCIYWLIDIQSHDMDWYVWSEETERSLNIIGDTKKWTFKFETAEK